MQRITQNVPLEEGDGVEGSVLSAGGHVSFEHQFRRESFELLAVGHGGRLGLICPDIAPQPMEVGFHGGERLVLAADGLSRPLYSLNCMHNRLIMSCLCSRLLAFQETNQPSHGQSWVFSRVFCESTKPNIR